jgi:hypothetical protein
MRRPREVEGLRVVVVVVVDDGMLAMTVARTDSGDTPMLAVPQAVISRQDAAATAPTRAGVGVIMPSGEADLEPNARTPTSGCETTRCRVPVVQSPRISVREWRQVSDHIEDSFV